MQFSNEDEVQAFLHSLVGGRREVPMSNGGRIDILTDQHGIEVKPNLTRSALLQALGQLMTYQADCGDRKLVIAGLTPKNQAESYSTASRCKEAGVQVWYLDAIPKCIEAYQQWAHKESATSQQHLEAVDDYSCQSPFSLLDKVAIGFVVLATWGFGACISSNRYEPFNDYPAVQQIDVDNSGVVPYSDQPGGSEVGRLPGNFEVEIIESYNDWRKIQWQTHDGEIRSTWIESKYLK